MSDGDEAELVQRMRERLEDERVDLMDDLDAAASPSDPRLLKSPPATGRSAHGDEFATDYAEMEAQQQATWAASPANPQAASPPPVLLEVGSENGSSRANDAAGRRYAKDLAPAAAPALDRDHRHHDDRAIDAVQHATVFGTAGRFPEDQRIGEKIAHKGGGQPTLGAVSSIAGVTGVDTWMSKHNPKPVSPSRSPIPEEEQQPAEISSRRLSRSLNTSRDQKTLTHKREQMDRHPAEKKVFAATFETTGRGDLFATEKTARHGSVHQRSHHDEFHEVHKPGRSGPGWSNVRWSSDASNMLDGHTTGRAQQRDLYGQTEADKDAQRARIANAQREHEERQSLDDTPTWQTNRHWKTSIRAVHEPDPPPVPAEPPTVQMSPHHNQQFRHRESGQTSPFLSKPREDLFHHQTSSPRPGQLHESDTNEHFPLRGDLPDHTVNTTDNASFKAAAHAMNQVNQAGWMLNHEVRPFEGDSQVVQVAKEKWGNALAGAEGGNSARGLQKSLGYANKVSGTNKGESGMNASVNRSTCKTKHSLSDHQVHAVRWVHEDSDDRFDRTSHHHPQHYKRLLHGTSAESQKRVADTLGLEVNPTKGSVVSTLVNRNSATSGGRKNGSHHNQQVSGAQERWWTRGEGFYDIRKKAGYRPGGAGLDPAEPEAETANGTSSRPVSSPTTNSARSRRAVYTGPGGGATQTTPVPRALSSDGSRGSDDWREAVDLVGGNIMAVPEGTGVNTRTTRAKRHPLGSNPKQSPSCDGKVIGSHELWLGREMRNVSNGGKQRGGPPAIGGGSSAAVAEGGSPGEGDRTRSWVNDHGVV